MFVRRQEDPLIPSKLSNFTALGKRKRGFESFSILRRVSRLFSSPENKTDPNTVLHDELLCLIFLKVSSSPQSLCYAKFTCRKWNRIITSKMLVKVCDNDLFNNFAPYMPIEDDEEWQPVLDLMKRRITTQRLKKRVKVIDQEQKYQEKVFIGSIAVVVIPLIWEYVKSAHQNMLRIREEKILDLMSSNGFSREEAESYIFNEALRNYQAMQNNSYRFR